MPPTFIKVTKAGQTVFYAEAGRLGLEDSARLDFLLFASGVIGASYTILEDAAKRIATLGYETTFHPPVDQTTPNIAESVQATDSGALLRAEKVVLQRRLQEASDVLSRICANHNLGPLSEEAMRVLGRCRAAGAIPQ